jgi:hypothetical protein
MTGPSRPLPLADGCALAPAELETQLDRYRTLGRHATSVTRRAGEVLVHFSDDAPSGLLERTLDVERRCCPFIHTRFDAADRLLTITVERVDQGPRLDSLFELLSGC